MTAKNPAGRILVEVRLETTRDFVLSFYQVLRWLSTKGFGRMDEVVVEVELASDYFGTLIDFETVVDVCSQVPDNADKIYFVDFWYEGGNNDEDDA